MIVPSKDIWARAWWGTQPCETLARDGLVRGGRLGNHCQGWLGHPRLTGQWGCKDRALRRGGG